jgi:outer membrane protein assembly factor BamB
MTLPKVLLAVIAVPPAGLALVWLRPWKKGWIRKVSAVAGRLALSGLAIILSIVYAAKLGIIHVEMAGGGWKEPRFSLRDPERDREDLERHRAKQHAELPAPTTAPVAAVVEEPRVAPLNGATAPKSSWPDFRGPNRTGHYTEGPILTDWPAQGLQQLWRQPIGEGYASFVIADGKAYTIEQRRNEEVVAAYAIDSGRELWTDRWPARFEEIMGGDGPRATPVVDSGRIYALGAAGELRVLDAATGKRIWSKNILTDNDAENITWGMSNSPLVVDRLLVVTPGGPGKSVVAYDKNTGERVWTALSDRAAYTSPMMVTLAGQRQILVVTATRIVGLAIDGTLLWEYPWNAPNGIAASQPIVLDGSRVFVSAGYDHGSAVLEVSGAGESLAAKLVWESRGMKNRFNSAVAYENHIYGMDESILTCIDARTGERKWKGGRYGYGQLLLAGGYLVVLMESGELALVKATPDSHQELSRFPAIEGKTWNHPAIAGGILLARNAREMAAFRIGR